MTFPTEQEEMAAFPGRIINFGTFNVTLQVPACLHHNSIFQQPQLSMLSR